MCGRIEVLIDLIQQIDRYDNRTWDAWKTVNDLVNEVYGIDIGDALELWEKHENMISFVLQRQNSKKEYSYIDFSEEDVPF